jgi:hypothetical protein
MKLVNLKHNEDYVRFSKDLTIKVNDLITAEINICGGVATIDSKLFGKVIVLEDPDAYHVYYIGNKKTKSQGFKDLYNQLFQENYDDFINNLEWFAENEVLNTFENSINNLTKEQRIMLLKEQIEVCPTFESDCGRTILYRQWAVNNVLYALKIPQPMPKKYNKLHEASPANGYGVEISAYKNILNKLLNIQ